MNQDENPQAGEPAEEPQVHVHRDVPGQTDELNELACQRLWSMAATIPRAQRPVTQFDAESVGKMREMLSDLLRRLEEDPASILGLVVLGAVDTDAETYREVGFVSADAAGLLAVRATLSASFAKAERAVATQVMRDLFKVRED